MCDWKMGFTCITIRAIIQAEPGRYPRSRLGFFFLFCARVERGCLSLRPPRKSARSPVMLLVLAVFFLVWIRGGKLVRIGLPGFYS